MLMSKIYTIRGGRDARATPNKINFFVKKSIRNDTDIIEIHK